MAPSFGRIPPGTVDLFRQTTDVVRNQIMNAMPASTAEEVKAFTIEKVLGIVLRDWSENENTEGLSARDIKDLRSFVDLAASLAGSDLGGAGLPVYQATLNGLLEDWLANWNSEGDPGPPGPN